MRSPVWALLLGALIGISCGTTHQTQALAEETQRRIVKELREADEAARQRIATVEAELAKTRQELEAIRTKAQKLERALAEAGDARDELADRVRRLAAQPSGPAPRPRPSTPLAGSKVVTVRTAVQLVRAIAPNRTIRVMPGTYRLSSASGITTRYVSWSSVFDGQQLDIKGVQNLKILGVGNAKPRLLAKPRYAWVLRFVKSKHVVLDNLVLGHTPFGGCTGGVVAFESSSQARIRRSELFGSGTYGIELKQVSDFVMSDSLIRGCTYGILQIRSSTNVVFRRSTFRGNEEFDLVEIKSSPGVRFERCTVTGNRVSSRSSALLNLGRGASVVIDGGRWWPNNVATYLTGGRGRVKLQGSAAFRAQMKRLLGLP